MKRERSIINIGVVIDQRKVKENGEEVEHIPAVQEAEVGVEIEIKKGKRTRREKVEAEVVPDLKA